MEHKYFPKDQVVIQQNSIGNEFYILIKGKISIYVKKDHEEIKVAEKR